VDSAACPRSHPTDIIKAIAKPYIDGLSKLSCSQSIPVGRCLQAVRGSVRQTVTIDLLAASKKSGGLLSGIK
jgi:hypothetical protein